MPVSLVTPDLFRHPPSLHPRLDRGPRCAFGRARGEPLGAELPAAPSHRRPHIPAAVPRSDCHPAASSASVSRTSPSSSLVRFRAKMYSTGTSSSHLGTKSPGFVLNRNLKFALGNKKPRFCTQPEPKRNAPSLTFLIVRSFRQVAAHQPASYAPAGQVSVHLGAK